MEMAFRQATETMTATRSSALKTTGPTCHARCHGNETVALAMGVWPQIRGIRRLTTTSSWDSPMVATVRMSRGERRNRRTTTISTVAVRRREATRPVARPRKKLTPEKATRPTARTAGAVPRSPWAKLMTLFNR
jgi:hypothetical protein